LRLKRNASNLKRKTASNARKRKQSKKKKPSASVLPKRRPERLKKRKRRFKSLVRPSAVIRAALSRALVKYQAQSVTLATTLSRKKSKKRKRKNPRLRPSKSIDRHGRKPSHVSKTWLIASAKTSTRATLLQSNQCKYSLVIWLTFSSIFRFPHTQDSIKEGKKKFNTECKEVVSEELTVHMKALSLSWMKQSFSLEQQRQMH